MLYVVDADDGAALYAGLRRDINRATFEARLRERSSVLTALHRLDVQAGDALLVPSGRVHAVGGGIVIVEIQQNSDTTYRVDDFGRTGLDGRPRKLHVGASMRAINFDDVEPGLQPAGPNVAVCEFFTLRGITIDHTRPAAADGEAAIVAVTAGYVVSGDASSRPARLFSSPPTAARATSTETGRRSSPT